MTSPPESLPGLSNRLTFYYPLIGLVNLIVYVLKNPHSPSVVADVSLMDIVVGHFGYLEFISSSVLVFPFPREITSYTRRMVERANKSTPQGALSTPSGQAAVVAVGDRPVEAFESNWAPPIPSLVKVSPYTLLSPTEYFIRGRKESRS